MKLLFSIAPVVPDAHTTHISADFCFGITMVQSQELKVSV